MHGEVAVEVVCAIKRETATVDQAGCAVADKMEYVQGEQEGRKRVDMMRRWWEQTRKETWNCRSVSLSSDVWEEALHRNHLRLSRLGFHLKMRREKLVVCAGYEKRD